MATRGPYVVRLVSPDNVVAVDAFEPSWSNSWRGGFKEATVKLHAPLNVRNPLLAPMNKLRIEDERTGKILSETYLDLPGRSRDHGGEVWEIGGVGPSARTFDRKLPYIGIDTSFEGWKQTFATKTSRMTAGTGNLPAGAEEGADCLLLQWQNGIAVDDTDRLTMQYDRLRQTGQQVGGFQFTHREGFASTVQRTQVLTRTAGGSEEIARNLAWVTSLTQSSAASAGVGAAFPTGRNLLKLRIYRSGGTAQNTDTENWWSGVTQMRISALRRDAAGAEISGSGTYDNAYVLAHELVTDMLFWYCGQLVGSDWISAVDLLDADIDQTFTYQIDQFVNMDPTTLGDLLEDLALFEPDMIWQLGESNSDGQHRFVLRRALDGSTLAGDNESGARYIASAVDGWEEPGAEHELYNGLTVSWEDGTGKTQSKSYQSAEDFGIDVPDLDKWGILREGNPIMLESRLGSVANADRIAEKYLERAATKPQAGKVTLRRKIHDAWHGRDIDPWEVETGYPMLVYDVDGLKPMPVTDLDVDDNEAVATLAEPVLTDEQLVNLYARGR